MTGEDDERADAVGIRPFLFFAIRQAPCAARGDALQMNALLLNQ